MTSTKSTSVSTVGTRLHDGTLLNAIYKASTNTAKLVVLSPNGNYDIHDHYQDKCTGIDYYPLVDNLVQSGNIVLPEDIGPGIAIEDLRNQVLEFILRYVDLEPVYLNLVVDYTWNTYFFDLYEKVGYLRFFGLEDTGKSRALKVLRSISRNSYYLGSSATPANVYRTIDMYGYISMFIDEANFYDTNKTSPVTQLLNDGYSEDATVTRCDSQSYTPKSYHAYGPKIFANHTTFDDVALESRMFTIRMKHTSRTDIPESIPRLYQSKEAVVIRNNLLRARLDLNSLVNTGERITELYCYSSRAREITYPLLLSQRKHDVPNYLRIYLDRAKKEQLALRMSTPEVIIAASIIDLVEQGEEEVLTAKLAHIVEDQVGFPIHPKTVNNQLRKLGIMPQRSANGTRIHLTGIDTTQIRLQCNL